MTVRAPVVVILFNRPAFTAALMEILRIARPPTLVLVADGPRPHVAGDAEACAAARAAARAAVDWPCEVVVDFAAEHVGCATRVESGLRVAFEHVDRVIVLEDDVRPDASFFGFCDHVLDEYADDERVAHVAGRNPLGSWHPERASYHFSRVGSVWGWATWRRAWADYDRTLARYRTDETRRTLREIAQDPAHAEYLLWLLDSPATVTLDTWDIQWSLVRLATRTLSVVPAHNLVTNVGFGAMATNTTTEADIASVLGGGRLDRPYRPPRSVAVDLDLDADLTCYDRLRSLRDPSLASLVARVARRPDVRRALRINPATANALAGLDDVDRARRVLAHVRAHGGPSPLLEELVAGLDDLATRRAVTDAGVGP